MRKLLVLLLLCFASPVFAADNYAATAGSGLTFAAKDSGGVLFSRFIGCDNTTTTQCWTVDASGRLTALSVQSGTWTVQPGNTANTTPWLTSVSQGGNTAVVKAGNTAGTTDVAIVTADANLKAAVEAPVPACAASPCTTVIGAVVGYQGTAALSATNGWFANILQGNAVLSATNPSFSAPIPTTAGGLSVYNVQPAASDNHVVIKAGAGQVYKVEAFNNSATVNYVRLYNATTGFNGCNSATNLIWQGIIPASTSGAGLSSSWDLGIAFATGISICVTSGYAQTDTTNATASALIINVGYK